MTAAVGARLRGATRSGPTPALTAPVLLVIVAAAMLFSACDEPVRAESPRSVVVAQIADEQIPAAILDECHRPLRGRMARIAATVTFSDDSTVRLFAELPDRVRIQGENGLYLLRDDQVYRLDEQAMSAADEQRLRRLAHLVDAAAFGALHRAASCERDATHGYRITTERGRSWQLRLRPDTLLPASLASDGREVRFDEYLRTKTTWVVKTATTDGLGRCRLRFDDGGIRWRPDFFEAPQPGQQKPVRNGGQRMTMPSAVVEGRSAVPKITNGKATGWVLLSDPITWPERVAAYREVYDELVAQNQHIAGFPAFWTEGGKRWLAAPFRQRPGQQALQAPSDWRILHLPASRWLVVHPKTGDLQARIRAGTELLRQALAKRNLTAVGPITAQPFIHLHEGEPSAEKLQATVVRCAVRIE